MTEFEGFAPGVRKWFKGLEADNSREYFAANRDYFEASIRDQMEALLVECSEEFGGEVKLFRQHRDVRFSPNKAPYKTNTYGIVHGPGVPAGGLYASISADALVAGGGYYSLARDQLDRYREAVADAALGSELRGLVDAAQAAGLELWGESLASAPRGYPKEHEQIELLRRKNLVLGTRHKFGRGISRTDGLRFVSDTWRAVGPVARWLDAHVGPSELPTARRGRRR